MFDSPDQIRALVELLDERQASLWHACQLTDLRSYLRLGGVPSRERMERDRVAFTAYASDSRDRTNHVWDKVFFDLGDLGRPFAWGQRATPCAYGPIALQFAPVVLSAATDVAVCLRSAGALGFDRTAESLSDTGEVEKTFAYPVEAGFPRSTWTRFGDSLKEPFPTAPDAKRPEISCTVSQQGKPGLVGFDSLVVVWVDPIDVDGQSLVDLVRDAIQGAGLAVPIHERSMAGERRSVLQDIVFVLRDGYVPLKLLPGRHGTSAQTQAWALDLIDRDLGWLWDRFAQHLIEGTIAPLSPTRPASTQAATTRQSVARPAHVAEVLDRLKEQ